MAVQSAVDFLQHRQLHDMTQWVWANVRPRWTRGSWAWLVVVMRKAPTKADSIILIVGSITLKLPWVTKRMAARANS